MRSLTQLWEQLEPSPQRGDEERHPDLTALPAETSDSDQGGSPTDRSSEQALETGGTPEAQPEQRLIRIAIADDQPIIREALSARLALEPDFQVVAEARDGFEALEILRTAAPDILILDLNMPQLDGIATLRHLQTHRFQARIIVLTASEDRNKHIQAMKLGASGVVLKQTTTELLIKSIRKVHSGEIWLDRRTIAVLVKQLLSPGGPPAGGRVPPELTTREREVLELVGQGLKNKQIAEKLYISEQTVKNHLHSIFRKLGFGDRLELTLYALHQKAAGSQDR